MSRSQSPFHPSNYAALRATIARAKRHDYQKIVMHLTLAEELLDQLSNCENHIAELAAESAGLIEQAEEVYAAGYNHGHLNTVDGIAYADCVKDDFYGLAVELMREAETPTTDAFLAEVRAQGVEMAAQSEQFSTWVQQGLRSFAIGVRQGDDCANELRKGA